jgi:hypothetical protein
VETQRGTSKWYIYNFIADRLIRSLRAKIRALTRRTSQQDLGYVLARPLRTACSGVACCLVRNEPSRADRRLWSGL